MKHLEIDGWDVPDARYSQCTSIVQARIRDRLTWILWVVAGILGALPLHADDSVSLPLKGYYHPGKYMPVKLTISPRSAAEGLIRLGVSGSISTYVRFEGGPIDTTVPWMVLDDRSTSLEWYVPPRLAGGKVSTPLIPLDDHQRIIGYAGVDVETATILATKLFPGDTLLPFALDPVQPLPGSPAAWQTVDAVILSAAMAAEVGETRFANLVSGGVAFAMPTVDNHALLWPNWPWKKIEGWQVLQFRPAGPTADTYSELNYAPVSSWRSGWPSEIRLRLLLGMGVFSVIALLAALLPVRRAVGATVLISMICIGALAGWADHNKPTQTVGGKIRIIASGITQDDDWAYQISHQDSMTAIRWMDTTWILPASRTQLDRSNARIVCYPNGDPDFIFFTLPAGMKMALLSRRCGPQPPLAKPSNPVSTPLQPLVKEIYLKVGDEVVGEFRTAALLGEHYATVQQWPGVLIRRPAGADASE